MSLLATPFLHLPKRPQSPQGRGWFQIFYLGMFWSAVALMAVNFSCAGEESATTSEIQAKAAAALAAAEAGTNLMATSTVAANIPAPASGPPKAANISAPVSALPNAKMSANTSANAGKILTNGMNVLDDTYKLAVGDTVTFQIVEDDDQPQFLPVEDSGDLEIPYIGRYPAAGKTCKQLALELKKELEKKYYYHATVIISVNTMITHGVVYVVGGVRSPGPLEMPKDEELTVSKAILRAGGFDDFADEKNVRDTRKTDAGTNEVLMINVSDVLDKGETWKDVKVAPGDYIYVSERVVHF